MYVAGADPSVCIQSFLFAEIFILICLKLSVVCVCCIFLFRRYRDSVVNTVEENSSISSLI